MMSKASRVSDSDRTVKSAQRKSWWHCNIFDSNKLPEEVVIAPRRSKLSPVHLPLSRVPHAGYAAGDFEVVTMTDAAEVGSLQIDSGSSLEANAFYEPWMLQAALRALRKDDVLIVVVRHRSAGTTGIFPFEFVRRFRGLPMRALRSWRHLYCFLCTPLVNAEYAEGSIEALFDWLSSPHSPAKLVEWELVAADGPFNRLLEAAIERREKWRTLLRTYQRAFFRNTESDVETGVSGRHLKELRRLGRRLEDLGACSYRVMTEQDSIAEWMDAFLELEKRGWKGREQTALASDAESLNFFRGAAMEAAGRGKLQMLALELNGVAIAMKCNFLAGDGAFAFKIAYDEQYAKYSPGVQLELFNMRNLKNGGQTPAWMDSCAISEHFMINRLWHGRRTVGDRLMGTGVISALMVANWGRYQRARSLLRTR